jgi:hypothetical protein
MPGGSVIPVPPGTNGLRVLLGLAGSGVGDWFIGMTLLYGPTVIPGGNAIPGPPVWLGGSLPSMPVGIGVGDWFIGITLP